MFDQYQWQPMDSRPGGRWPGRRWLRVCLVAILVATGTGLLPGWSAVAPAATHSTAGLLLASTSAAAGRTPPTAESAGLSRRLDPQLAKLGQAIITQVRSLAGRFEQNPNLRVEIRAAFYDERFRRVFIAFSGSATFTGRLPWRPAEVDRAFTSDGAIAYDLLLTRVKVRPGAIGFDYEGDLVLFIDKLVYRLAKESFDLAGGVALSIAIQHLLDFVSGLDLGLIADAISRTCKSFSKESLATSGAELIDRALRADNRRLAELIRASVKNGGIASFLSFTILRSAVGGVGGCVGATIGAAAGNALVPGIGGVVGGFLGARFVSTIARTVVYDLTVDVTIKLSLRRMVNDWRERGAGSTGSALTAGAGPAARLPVEGVAGDRDVLEGGRFGRFLMNRIRREMDRNDFEAFDKTLATMKTFPAAERPAFVPMLRRLHDILQFRLLQGGDWYAAKKLHQLRAAIEAMGLAGAMPQ